MTKFFTTTMITGIICGCITMFITYSMIHMSKVNGQIDKWEETYNAINKDVSAFTEVSDPKTIRSYVKQLNDILDDITFLGKIVESGQTSAESLDEFFSEYQRKLDEANDMIFGHHVELTELEDKFKEQVTRLVEETEDNLELINSLAGELDEQNMYVNQLNIKLGQSIQEVEDDVQTIKSSKYGKKIWKIKK